MIEFFKKNKKCIFSFILGGLIFSSISVSAAILIAASDVSFTSGSGSSTKNNVQDALDEIYSKIYDAQEGGKEVVIIDKGFAATTSSFNHNGNYAIEKAGTLYVYAPSTSNNNSRRNLTLNGEDITKDGSIRVKPGDVVFWDYYNAASSDSTPRGYSMFIFELVD